jgi:phosphodiesterase/alkaline phosphatase D-like protein
MACVGGDAAVDVGKAEQAIIAAREFLPRADLETFVHLGDQISHYEAVETRYPIKMPKRIEQNARLMGECIQ